MSSSGPVNAQARKLLQALCKFIIPLVKPQVIKDMTNVLQGVEADALISELESFVLNVQRKKVDKHLEVVLPSYEYYFKGTDWFWQLPYAESSTIVEEMVDDQGITLHQRGSHSGFEHELQYLQRHIPTAIPIRVLYFEPYGPNLKITLLDRSAVYTHLAQKLQSAYFENNFDYDHVGDWTDAHLRYAILSHTWTQTPGELTYTDLQDNPDIEDPKCRKLVNFCKAAWEDHGLTLGWIDTVCIDKGSSSELDESIRSMYKWYSCARVCITYLGETNSLSDMPNDSWFTRGWTLQELIAPPVIKFYNKDWVQLVPSEDNDKEHPQILNSIESATKITPKELDNIREVSISRRMELAAMRKVTREEDTAYSLMGIFNVSMSTAYGEGRKRAFFRLLKEIVDTYKNATDIFNWGAYSVPSSTTSLFPRDISHYTCRSTDPNLRPWRPIEPLTLTHLGLRTPVLLMSATFSSESDSGQQPVGDYHANVSVQVAWRRQQIRYHLLQTRDFTYAIGVLNVQEYADGNSIGIPKTCFAVLLRRVTERPNSPGRYKKIATSRPIVFTLEETGRADTDSGNYYIVEKDRLWDHGTKLVTLYL